MQERVEAASGVPEVYDAHLAIQLTSGSTSLSEYQEHLILT